MLSLPLISQNQIIDYVDERDGKIYPTIKIKDKIWFAKNLEFEPENGKYWTCRIIRDTEAEFYHHKKQFIYNWETARNVCPDGWSLPSKEDFQELIGYCNDSVFCVLRPGGYSGFEAYASARRTSGILLESGWLNYWTSTESGVKTSYVMFLDLFNETVEIESNYKKKFGFPVRCVKKYSR